MATGSGAAPARIPAPSRINYARVVLCGIVTALVWTAVSIPAMMMFGQAFMDALVKAGSPVHSPFPVKYLLYGGVASLVLGTYSMWVYAAIRPRFGPGPRTAVIAGAAVWLFGAMTDAVWGSLGLIPAQTLLAPVFGALPRIVVAVLIGARFYRE